MPFDANGEPLRSGRCTMADNLRYLVQTAGLRDGRLRIHWRDGHLSEFHAIWLRHQCECTQCGTPVNAVRALRLHHIAEDIAIAGLTVDRDNVAVEWSHDGHRSRYRVRWLRDHCYSDSERHRRRHRPVLWDGSIHQQPPRFDFAALEADDSRRLAMLEAVCDYGFCCIDNLPGSVDEAHRMISLVGTKRQTHFGDFQLSKKSRINNVGDIRHALAPHCDETYRSSTIGITVFQVIRPSSDGGHSTLVDGFEAVRRLRQDHPDDFDLLTRLPVYAQRYDPDHGPGELPRWYQCRLPMIRLDPGGEVSGIRINERQMSPLDLAPDEVEPAYRAIRRLLSIVYDPALLVTFPLTARQGLVFDNQRVLHGRTAFQPEEPGRVVLTNSVNIEDFHSNLRVLTSRLKPDQPPLSYAQGLVT